MWRIHERRRMLGKILESSKPGAMRKGGSSKEKTGSSPSMVLITGESTSQNLKTEFLGEKRKTRSSHN
jgi:hypothetical protein